MVAGLRYRLFGPVTGPGRLGGPKQRAVLAALLLNANRVVSEERLVAEVWGAHPPLSARGRLQVYISELRKSLGSNVITRQPPGYAITVGPGELDLQVFDDAVARARQEASAGRHADAATTLRAALQLWQGPALNGLAVPLVDAEAPALEERRLSALEDLHESELAAGRHLAIIGDLRRLIDQFPLRERFHGQLMSALQRAGRVPESLHVYSDLQAKLATELGIRPGSELRELHQRILTDEPCPVRPDELPADVAGFAGRAREMAWLDEQLETDDPATVCVISGTAGVGKTALAVRWGHSVREQFPDGQLYADLRGFDPDQAPLTVGAVLVQLLRALGVQQREIPTDPDDQARMYRSVLADRRVMLVLDNARDAGQVFPLLPSAGAVLVTSRNWLGDLVARAGARSLQLDVLSARGARDLLAGALGEARVAAEPEAVEELARLCGHLPLALRVIAAKIGAAQGDISELLPGLDPRHAVTAALHVSYDALPPAEKRLFRLLGLVPGQDFTPTVAAALGAVPVAEATRRLKGLAAAHLVEQRSFGRYRFHDLIRGYAVDRVRADETRTGRDQAWSRLVESYVSAADCAVDLLDSYVVRLPRESRPETVFIDSGEALAWLTAEGDNLAATLRQAASIGPYPAAWYLADAVRILFHHLTRGEDWFEVAKTVLSAARRAGEERVEALAHQTIGTACVYMGRLRQAIRHLTEAAEIYRKCGWLAGEATAVHGLGAAMQTIDDLAAAQEYFGRSLELYRLAGSHIGELTALNSLGLVHRERGNLARAEECLNGAVALGKENRFAAAASLVGLAHVWHDRGLLTEAQQGFVRATDIHRQLGHLEGEASALVGLAGVEYDLGDFPQARAHALRALELARQRRNRVVQANALIALGHAETALGLLREAGLRHREAAAVAERFVRPGCETGRSS